MRIMAQINPEGAQQRRQRRLKRRTYSCKVLIKIYNVDYNILLLLCILVCRGQMKCGILTATTSLKSSVFAYMDA